MCSPFTRRGRRRRCGRSSGERRRVGVHGSREVGVHEPRGRATAAAGRRARKSWTLEPRRSACTPRGLARQRRRSRGRRARASWTRGSGGGSACTEVVDARAAEVGVTRAPWGRAATAAGRRARKSWTLEPRSACTSLVDARQRRRVGVHASPVDAGAAEVGVHASPVDARGSGGVRVDAGAAVGVHEPRGRRPGRRVGACTRAPWTLEPRRSASREPRGRAAAAAGRRARKSWTLEPRRSASSWLRWTPRCRT
jgi:hypothetical protein